MKVKIGNTIYDSSEEPIMLILSNKDKEIVLKDKTIKAQEKEIKKQKRLKIVGFIGSIILPILTLIALI